MTFRTNARLAGSAFLIYIASGIGSMALPSDRRAVLVTLMALSALTLGSTLYAITRDVARDLALLAMLCRVLEAAGGNGEIYFAVASTIFSWLLLRGQIIPAALAWLGLAASGALVLQLLVQQTMGMTTNWSSPITWLIWLPLLVFELALAAVLLADRARPYRGPAAATL